MIKIVVTPLIGIGDVLLSTPALEIIKRVMPGASVTYCTLNTATYEVLKGNPHIDKLLFYPMLGPHKLAAIWQLFRECSGRYQISINFYPSNRIHYNLFSLLTLAPRRIGHRYLRMNISQANWLKTATIPETDTRHCVEENIALLRLIGIEPSGITIPGLRLYLSAQECEEGRSFRRDTTALPLIGVHAGTSVLKNASARRWPKERFAELISRIPNAHFALFGTAEEEAANRYIIQASSAAGRISLVNDKTIRQAAAIIRACDGFITNDSGLMHAAAAVGTPVIALIGPTNPVYIRPWGVENRVVTAPISCLHCFHYSPKPLRCINKNRYECLSALSVDAVETAVKEFLGRFGGRGAEK